MRSLGFSDNDETVYRALIADPGLDIAGIGERCRLDGDQVRASLDSLSAAEVIRLESTGITVLQPSLALGQLIERTEDELMTRYRQVSGLRSQLASLDQSLGRVQSPDLGGGDEHGLERIEGLDAVRERIDELAFYSRKSIYSIQPGGPQSAEALEASRPLDLRAARRRTVMRVIHESSVLSDELNRVYLRELAMLGTQARFYDEPITRMLILDEQVAVVPIDPRNSKLGALIVRHPGLVAGMLDLFNRTWNAATEIVWDAPAVDTDTEESVEVTEQDRAVLKLLSTGGTDETAARELGVSVRHLRRRISRLMLLLEASSRFEAGVEAARRGWL